MILISCKVFDKLLSNRRTALLGIVEVQEHIEKRRECTLVVNTVVGVETLVLGAHKGIANVLRYSVYRHRDTLNVGFYSVQHNEFFFALVIGL